MNKKQFLKPKYIFLIILLVQLIYMFFWCSQKEGFYIDELWSYGLSNSYYEPFLQLKDNYMNEFHESDYYKNYLVVNDNEAFRFDSVIYNQINDVHPPLFYSLLHLLSSIFRNTFSKWYGLAINIIFFICTEIYVYKISKHIIKTETSLNLIAPALYGFCLGTVSCVLYIRMYMVLSFWCIAFLYYSIRIMSNDRISDYIKCSLCALCGFLTQYYFVIFAFFVAISFFICTILQKKGKIILKYFLINILAGCIGIVLFPAAINHVLKTDRGQESISNIGTGIKELIHKIYDFKNVVSIDMFGNKLVLDIVFLVCLIIFIFLICQKKMKESIHVTALITLIISCAGYFLLISLIAPEIVSRYQYPIYPEVILIISMLLITICLYWDKSFIAYILCGLTIVLFLITPSFAKVPYLYKGYETGLEKVKECESAMGIYLTHGDHIVINDTLFLSNQKQTYPVKFEEIDKLIEVMSQKSVDEIVLYVNIYYDSEECSKKVANLFGLKNIEFIYDNAYTNIYHIY